MIKNLPNKHVRKAIYDRINNIVVDGVTIPCYDVRLTNNVLDHYILLTTQSSSTDKANKCENRWESSILIDIVTTYSGMGNTGTRLLVDNISEEVIKLVDNLTLDVSSGLTIVNQTTNLLNDVSFVSKTQNIFRNLIRVELTIN